MASILSRASRGRRLLIAGAGLAVLVVGIAVVTNLRASGQGDGKVAAQAAEAGESSAETAADAGTIQLPRGTWKAAGLRVASAERGALTQSAWVTGRIALNEDRVAHVFSLVEGRVQDVDVRYGQRVRAGEVLAIVQSKEVGQARLELFRARQARQFAETNLKWSEQVAANTQALLEALETGTSLEEIHEQFRDRPIGDLREKLLAAHAESAKSRIDYDRLERLAERGIAPGKDLTAAAAARDSDRAASQAWREQARFTSQRERMQARQAFQEAETRVSVAETNLKILGCDATAPASADLDRDGAALAHYPIRAPFDGTIIGKDLVLMERVSPERQLLQIADLSTVWIQADIYDRHLPLLQQLAGKTIRVRSEAYSGAEFEARVAFTGEIVDPASRTIALTAVAENPEGLLKPGLFVEIELPGASAGDVLLVPEGAVQEHAGQRFVFLHAGDDRFVRRDVAVGRRSDGQVEIIGGLEPGEPVVVEGAFALKSQLLADLLSDE